MRFVMHSPNSKLIVRKTFSTVDEAGAYYHEQSKWLMGRSGVHMVKLEWKTDDGTLYRRMTILNEGGDRCAIEVYMDGGTDKDGSPTYAIAHLQPIYKS